MHTGELSFSIGSCIPSKYMNQGKPLRSSFHQRSRLYHLNHFSLTIHLVSYGPGSWVTKIILDFAGFLMAFSLEIWTYISVFLCVSQGHLLKTSKGHIKVLGPWCSSCCISSCLTESRSSSSLLLLLLLFLSYSFFLGCWAFMVFLNFMNGPSFVKAHGLSLFFMEWAIM